MQLKLNLNKTTKTNNKTKHLQVTKTKLKIHPYQSVQRFPLFLLHLLFSLPPLTNNKTSSNSQRHAVHKNKSSKQCFNKQSCQSEHRHLFPHHIFKPAPSLTTLYFPPHNSYSHNTRSQTSKKLLQHSSFLKINKHIENKYRLR